VLGALLRVVFVVPAFLLFVPSLTLYSATVCLGELVVAIVLGVVGAASRVVPSVIPRIDFGASDVRGAHFRFGGLGVISQAAGVLYLATDNLLIGRIYGPARVTEYSLGTRWAPLISSFLWAGISALTPLITQMEARGEVDRTRKVVLRAAAVASAIGVPTCLVPCVVGDVFLARWVGPEYRRSVSYMIAMLAPTMVTIALEPVWMAMVARGRIGWIAAGDILVAVGNPILSLILALKFGLGLLGFALGNTVALLAKNLLLRPLAGRSEAALPSIGRTLLTLPAALLGGAPALILLYFLKPYYEGSLSSIMAAGLVAGALSLAGATLTAVGWKDTLAVVNSLLRRRSAGTAAIGTRSGELDPYEEVSRDVGPVGSGGGDI
jgi:O-antigen/teichoic acid export membrane protein